MNKKESTFTQTLLIYSMVTLGSSSALAQGVEDLNSTEESPRVEVAECVQSSNYQVFRAIVASGEESFASLDREGLIGSYDLAKIALMCLEVQHTAESSSAFHRLSAMVDFVSGESDMARAEFHRARILQPGYELPPRIAPEGHPLAVLYEDSLLTFTQETLEAGVPPVDGFLIVDGVRGGARSAQADVIVQVYDMTGELIETTWVEAGAILPLWGPPPSESFANEIKRPMAVASGVSLLASGVLYAMARNSRARFDSDEWLSEQASNWASDNQGEAFPAEDILRDLSSEIDALSYASLGTGILAAGLGLGLSMVW